MKTIFLSILLFALPVAAQQESLVVFQNFTELRGANTANRNVQVNGRSSFNDGYAGIFRWVSAASGADDNESNLISTRTGNGRWIRVDYFGGSAPGVPSTISILGTNSIAGGGRLTNSWVFSLVGDIPNPGPGLYYGTPVGGGSLGYYALSSGAGDVTATGNNTLTGINDFRGGLIRHTFDGITNLNWSTMNKGSITVSNDFQVTFSGSPSTSQLMEYDVVNNAFTNISILIPESIDVRRKPFRVFSTNVIVEANSSVQILWQFDGTYYQLAAGGADDDTLVSLADSGFQSGRAGTVDTNKTTIKTITLSNDWSASIDAFITAGSKTNSASFSRRAAFRATTGGVISQVGSTTDLDTQKSAGATTWDVAIETDGASIFVQAFGDAVEPVNFVASIFKTSWTNGIIACTNPRDSKQSGLASDPLQTGTYYWHAVKVKAGGTYKICKAVLRLYRVGNPTGNLQVAIYSNNAGLDIPDALYGTASLTVAKSAVGTTVSDVEFGSMAANFVANSQYWMVFKSTASDDGSNYIGWEVVYLGGGSHNVMSSQDDGAGWAESYGQSSGKYILFSN